MNNGTPRLAVVPRRIDCAPAQPAIAERHRLKVPGMNSVVLAHPMMKPRKSRTIQS
jgi:hypothetical protein